MPERPLLRAGGPRRKKGLDFDIKQFVLIILAALALFLFVIGTIRWWQKADLLDYWLKQHPRYNGQLWEQQQAEKAKKPWLGADASVLDAKFMLQRARPRDKGINRNLEDLLPATGSNGHGAFHLQQGGVHEEQAELIQIPLARRRKQHKVDSVWPLKRWPVTLKDLVVAIPNHKITEPQLKAGRSARTGMRTFVATNYSENESGFKYPKTSSETWGSYPDATPVRSFYPGDERAALTPFLAYKSLGETFKWVLYGDDDTVFFTEAALNLASTMDPELPYFVTDNLWWSPLFGGAWHPNPLAPRCLPCGYTKNVTSAMGMSMTAGCPCTPAEICNMAGGYDGTFADKACGAPRSPARTYSMHGGAGALISIGLLRKIDWTSMERCVNHQWSSGGDAFLSVCLWEHGFAHTTPDPIWHPRSLQMFDPSPAGLNPDDFIIWKAGHVLGNMLQQAAGVCNGICQLEVNHTVSLHLRARRTGGSEEGAAAFIRAFSRLSAKITGRMGPVETVFDASDVKQQKLAEEIDATIYAGIQLVQALTTQDKVGSKQKKASQAGANKLKWGNTEGNIDIRDTARSGIADAVARQILETILNKVKKAEDMSLTAEKSSKPAGLPGDELEDLVKELTETVQRS